MGKVISKFRKSKEEDEDVEEETSDGEECCGEDKLMTADETSATFKGMKKKKGKKGKLSVKGLKAPSLGGLGGLGGNASPIPCVCRDLFVIPLPDPTQVKDLLGKGRVGGDEGETKGEDKVGTYERLTERELPGKQTPRPLSAPVRTTLFSLSPSFLATHMPPPPFSPLRNAG